MLSFRIYLVEYATILIIEYNLRLKVDYYKNHREERKEYMKKYRNTEHGKNVLREIDPKYIINYQTNE